MCPGLRQHSFMYVTVPEVVALPDWYSHPSGHKAERQARSLNPQVPTATPRIQPASCTRVQERTEGKRREPLNSLPPPASSPARFWGGRRADRQLVSVPQAACREAACGSAARLQSPTPAPHWLRGPG